MEFYCVKCRGKVTVSDEQVTTQEKANRKMLRAKCPTCGTNMAKFGKKS
jgi:Zn finger protein HypA/HybF involved in hydrogenase expression